MQGCDSPNRIWRNFLGRKISVLVQIMEKMPSFGRSRMKALIKKSVMSLVPFK